MSKSTLKARNRYHLKKYKKADFDGKYRKIHNSMNKYILSFKSFDDRFTADFHCTYNLFIFALCKLNIWSQNTKEPQKSFYDVFYNHIVSKAENIGVANIGEKKIY